MKQKQLLLLSFVLLLCLGLFYPFANSLNQKSVPSLGDISCVSYTPFKGDEAPWQLDQGLVIPQSRFQEDLKVLAGSTHCIRTYSVTGLQELFPVARQMGFKVWFGIWISADVIANEKELQIAQKIISEYSDVIHVVIVGNEVLLRREQTGEKLVEYIERVKAFAQGLPITYADVWEFWQKNPQVAKVVDVVTIHILPYWENDPLAVGKTVAHIEKIYTGVAEQFYNKKIAIGEMGWPSRGRSREAAVASLEAQYEFTRGALALCASHKWDCNVIEAFDQPWKRNAEGGVGGAWGLWNEFRQYKMSQILTLPQDQFFAMFLGTGLCLLLGAVGICSMASHKSWRQSVVLLLICAGVGLAQGYALSDYVFYTRSLREGLWHGVLWVLPLFFLFLFFASDKLVQKFGKQALLVYYFLLLVSLMELVFDGRYRFFPLASLGTALLLVLLLPRWRKDVFEGVTVNPLLADVLLVLVTLLLNFEKLVNVEALLFGVITMVSLYRLPRRQNFKINILSVLLATTFLAVTYALRVVWLQSENLGEFCTLYPAIWHCQIRSATGYMIYWQIWGAVAYVFAALALWQRASQFFFWVALFFGLLASAFYNVDAGVVVLAGLLICKAFQAGALDTLCHVDGIQMRSAQSRK